MLPAWRVAAALMVIAPSGHATQKLVYSTYLGGSGIDDCDGIALDGARNIYLACHCDSRDFPGVTVSQPLTKSGDIKDFIVIKLGASGHAVRYRAHLGQGKAFGIAVDRDGFAYVVGWTRSAHFPVTPGALRSSFGGDSKGGDVVVAKLDPAGTVVWAGYLGGSGGDYALRIALDPAGNAYVAGETTSPDLPVTRGAFQTRYGGDSDGFVAKISPSGALLYSTYLGGSSAEMAQEGPAGLAVDAFGRVYVAGATRSRDFPLKHPLQRILAGESDAFVAGFDPSESALLFSTYLGGSGVERGSSIALGTSGDLYVSGWTRSTDFPMARHALQSKHEGGGEALFVARLTASRRELGYSSYVPGTEREGRPNQFAGGGLAVDAAGRATVVGNTTDGFVIQIDPGTPKLLFSTQLGGEAQDAFEDLAIDSEGSLYISGFTHSTDFPVVDPLQGKSGGAMDIVVLKFASAPAVPMNARKP